MMGLAKTVPSGRLVFRHNKAIELAWRSDAEEVVFRVANSGSAEAGGGRCPGWGFDPEGGDYGADVLSLEGEVCGA